MEWLMFIALLVGSILSISSLIAQKNPKAGESLQKLAPYQQWIGIALLIWGVIVFLFRFLLWIRYWGLILRFAPVFGIMYLAIIIMSIIIGLILSMSFLKTRKELPQAKIEVLDRKLSKIQVPMGIIGIAVCLLFFISYIVKF